MRRLLAVLLAALALTGCVSRSGPPARSAAASPERAEPDTCAFVANTDEDAPLGLPPTEPVTLAASTVTFRTSAGQVRIALAGSGAPCTVRSFVHLAGGGFYDGIACHRLTMSAGLKVLQCGDPKGDSTGGPGYTVPDEPPAGLEPASTDASGQQLVVYPRGTVAMAKGAMANSGGSQFFIVYGDSTLLPEYAVFGTVDATGLTAVDTVVAGGVEPVNSPEDGTPRTPVKIESAMVR